MLSSGKQGGEYVAPPGAANVQFVKFSTQDSLLYELYNLSASESLKEIVSWRHESPQIDSYLDTLGDRVTEAIPVMQMNEMNEHVPVRDRADAYFDLGEEGLKLIIEEQERRIGRENIDVEQRREFAIETGFSLPDRYWASER
jgi:hypothetical protein